MSEPNTVHGQAHVAHKTKTSGGKKKKSRLKDKKDRHNPKAFTFSGGVKSVQRKAQYALDHETKREHAKLIPNKILDESPPPIVVAVQGPPNVGKTTLIRSLVKHYTRHNVVSVKGPITLVSGKKRRITFLECPNDAPGMLDVAKVADLALVLIDGSLGFEMETFEFLNILQVHGFPKVIGVLTHLDHIGEISALRKTKKKLKNRFWSEIYQGAKLFYLSGLQFGNYNRTEILNLSRFIAVQKPHPLEFRSQRPYLVVLRHEDQTCVNHSKTGPTTRTLHFYGYVNGATLRDGTAVHIPGAGDFIAASATPYSDPCPLPAKSSSKNDSSRNLRTLKVAERRVYAPDCDIGHVNFDADALYINLPQHQIAFTPKDSERLLNDNDLYSDASQDQHLEHELPEPVALVRELQDASGKLNEKVDGLQLRLLRESTLPLKDAHVNRRFAPERLSASPSSSSTYDEDVTCDESENNDAMKCNAIDENQHNMITKEPLLPTVHEFRDALGHRLNWVSNLYQEKAKPSIFDRVYGRLGEMERVNERNQDLASKNLFDDESSAGEDENPALAEFAEPPVTTTTPRLLGECFPNVAQLHECELYDVAAYCGFGDSGPRGNDLISSLQIVLASWTKAELKKRYFITGGWDKDAIHDDNDAEQGDVSKQDNISVGPLEEIQHQRLKLRQEDLSTRLEIEKSHAFLQSDNKGVPIGTYCRIIVHDVPTAWVNHLLKNPRVIILGGLLPNECGSYGFLKARVKKHRWAPKILKTEDPLLISSGWRRFQSLPIYCIQDSNDVRTRYLKYTPEHMHCLVVFYGPFQSPNTGVLGIRNWNSNASDFRISVTGIILETAANFAVVKKLKLVGEPLKVYKNTAFIKHMFNSDLEVAKFIGSKIQTVSGIRGQIKKAQGLEGVFRATFEDKILMSDIVICKTWLHVELKRFCNPLLDIPEWKRLRTLVEIRRGDNFVVHNVIYVGNYGPRQQRETRRFNPLRIPKDIQKNLPFKSLPKDETKTKEKKGLLTEITKSSLSDYEKRVATLFQRLHLITKQRHLERKKSALEHQEKQQKIKEKESRAASQALREVKRRRCATQSLDRKKLRKRLRLED